MEKTYSIMLRVEGNPSQISTSEKASNANEAEQKARDRFGRMHPGKEITIISIKPPQ